MAGLFFPLSLILSASLHVSAASSLTDAVQELARIYQKQTGQAVVLNFGSSGTLARQIIEGAPADVFLSADERQMDRAAGERMIVPSTRRSIASNELVVVVPRDSTMALRSPRDLASATRIAAGDPMTVPAGNYARAYLERAGVWERIAPKVIPFENVRAALAAVEAGNVDCGIVYRTDAMISKEVRVAFVIEGHPPISYPAAVIATSHSHAAARRFLDFLCSPAAKAIFVRYGFSRRSTPAR